MNCSKHSDRTAVAQCSVCGAGICKECASKTELLKEDFGMLCIDCFAEKLDEISDFYSNDKRKRTVRLIVSIITYCIGLFLILGPILTHYNDFLPIAIMGVLLCGFYTGLTWRKAAQEDHEEQERKHGATYIITDYGIVKEDAFWTKIVFFIFGTLIGVVFTPIRIIIDAVHISKDRKYIMDIASTKYSAYAE